jgi:hypothetical protein
MTHIKSIQEERRTESAYSAYRQNDAHKEHTRRETYRQCIQCIQAE